MHEKNNYFLFQTQFGFLYYYTLILFCQCFDIFAQIVLNKLEAIIRISGVELTPIFLAYLFLSKNNTNYK